MSGAMPYFGDAYMADTPEKPAIPRGSLRGTGYVYFMLAQDGLVRPMVKIGFSRRNPEKRLSTCQTGSPTKLSLIAFIIGSATTEKDLHKQFKDSHSHGEWFFYDEHIHEFLAEACA